VQGCVRGNPGILCSSSVLRPLSRTALRTAGLDGINRLKRVGALLNYSDLLSCRRPDTLELGELKLEEFFPVLLAAAFAITISQYTGGVAPWWVLSCVAVAASGLAATTFTGEFDENWLYLLQDLAEAAVGVALGLAIVRWVLPPRGDASSRDG
jgi:hypothetical protein